MFNNACTGPAIKARMLVLVAGLCRLFNVYIAQKMHVSGEIQTIPTMHAILNTWARGSSS